MLPDIFVMKKNSPTMNTIHSRTDSLNKKDPFQK